MIGPVSFIVLWWHLFAPPPPPVPELLPPPRELVPEIITYGFDTVAGRAVDQG